MQHPSRASSAPDMFCVCASALQCCSGVAAGHTALLSALTCVHRATLASATLQLLIRCYLCLPRSLQSQPTSCRQLFYLPPWSRTGGGTEFSLDFFSFWGWNSSVREPIAATLKLFEADKQVQSAWTLSMHSIFSLEQAALSGRRPETSASRTLPTCASHFSVMRK